jgi:hypothetical protein
LFALAFRPLRSLLPVGSGTAAGTIEVLQCHDLAKVAGAMLGARRSQTAFPHNGARPCQVATYEDAGAVPVVSLCLVGNRLMAAAGKAALVYDLEGLPFDQAEVQLAIGAGALARADSIPRQPAAEHAAATQVGWCARRAFLSCSNHNHPASCAQLDMVPLLAELVAIPSVGVAWHCTAAFCSLVSPRVPVAGVWGRHLQDGLLSGRQGAERGLLAPGVRGCQSGKARVAGRFQRSVGSLLFPALVRPDKLNLACAVRSQWRAATPWWWPGLWLAPAAPAF